MAEDYLAFLNSPGYKLATDILRVFGASYAPGKPSGEAVRLAREFIKDNAPESSPKSRTGGRR